MTMRFWWHVEGRAHPTIFLFGLARWYCFGPRSCGNDLRKKSIVIAELCWPNTLPPQMVALPIKQRTRQDLSRPEYDRMSSTPDSPTELPEPCQDRIVESEKDSQFDSLHTLKAKGRWTNSQHGVPARTLLDKLRWACLGPNFDWTNRCYLYEEPHRQMPAYLIDIAKECAQHDAPAMPVEAEEHFTGWEYPSGRM